MDFLSGFYEKGWKANVDDDGMKISRKIRGVHEEGLITKEIIERPEAKKIDQLAPRLQEIFGSLNKKAILELGQSSSHEILGPSDLKDAVIKVGKKGSVISRYKGLGEMNPGQLWETTLDPEARSLLQVQIEHEEDAQEAFSALMGEAVDQRRSFIQENALKVANLDI